MNKVSNIFFIMKALSDEEEKKTFEKLCRATVDSTVSKHRVLFYESSIGKLAIVRQLKPQLHIDYDIAACRQIGPHIKSVVHINSGSEGECLDLPSSSTGAKSIHSIHTIEELLTLSIR